MKNRTRRVSLLNTPFFIRLEEYVANQTRSIATEIYGTSYGLSQYVNSVLESANRDYLSSTHTHKSRNDFAGYQKGRELIRIILKSGIFQDSIDQKGLEDQVKLIKGIDPRTVRKWKKILEELGFLKREYNQSGRFIYRIIPDPLERGGLR